jgi:hypothetical protein
MVCAFSALAVGEGPTGGGRRAERALVAGAWTVRAYPTAGGAQKERQQAMRAVRQSSSLLRCSRLEEEKRKGKRTGICQFDVLCGLVGGQNGPKKKR